MKNVMDEARDQLVAAIDEADRGVREWAEGMDPYDAVKLSDEEEDFLFDNMGAAFPGQNLTNEQAMQQYLADVGPKEFVRFYESVYKRRMGVSGVAGSRHT